MGRQVLETEELRMVLETVLDPISDPGRKYYGTNLVMGLISAYFIKPALIVDQSMGLKKPALSFKKPVFSMASFPGVSRVVKKGFKSKWLKAKYINRIEKFL